MSKERGVIQLPSCVLPKSQLDERITSVSICSISQLKLIMGDGFRSLLTCPILEQMCISKVWAAVKIDLVEKAVETLHNPFPSFRNSQEDCRYLESLFIFVIDTGE